AGGYLAALIAAGLPPDPTLIAEGDYSRGSGHAAMTRLLALADPPTAVFAGNDLMAIGALMAAHAAGRRGPEELAIAGSEAIPTASVTRTALSTVAAPKYEMGRVAVGLLLARLRGAAPPERQHVELPCQLVVRGSS